MQDALDALIVHFLTVSDITDLCSTRIFGGEIPTEQIASMPQELVVVRYAGGFESMRTHRVQRVRMDVFSYGDGYKEAVTLDHAVTEAAHAVSRIDPGTSNTHIHSIGYGGPFMLREPDAGWHFVARTLLVIADERVAV